MLRQATIAHLYTFYNTLTFSWKCNDKSLYYEHRIIFLKKLQYVVLLLMVILDKTAAHHDWPVYIYNTTMQVNYV